MTDRTSPPAVGAVSAGIRYQVRFFWRQALPMLYGTRVAKVVMEHRGVDAVDDVVVYYWPPGVNDDGTAVPVDFHQVKFHVAQSGAVHHDALVDPAWTGTTRSMLGRFADAWNQIRGEHPNGRLKLVTNWPWDPQSELAPLVRDGGRLASAFLAAGARSRVGQIRVRWQEASGLDDQQFGAFIASLRFGTSAVSQSDAEEWLRDRCQLAGLAPIPHGVEWSPYDDLGKRLIETGRTEQTPASLRALVESQGLLAPGVPPFRSTFAVRSFTRFAHRPETDGACVVDLTDLFDGRLARQEDSWSRTIPDRLAAAVPQVEQLPEPVHVALDAHLSVAWHTGHLLDAKSGKRLVLRQRVAGKGIEIWDVSSPVRPDGAQGWTVSLADRGTAGPEIALVISATHFALTDASRFVAAALPAVGAIVHAELPSTGQQSVRDGGHARWLSDELIQALGPILAERRPAHLHVFPACPACLAFLLGQASRALGPNTIYEYDFATPGRGYRRGIITATE